MSTIEVTGAMIALCVFIYILGSVSNPWTKPLEPEIEYWHYTYTFIPVGTHRRVYISSVYVGDYVELILFIKSISSTAAITYANRISKADFIDIMV